MTPSRTLSKFNAVLDIWEAALSDYSETDFTKKPADDAWSIGQVYLHLVRSANGFHLKQVEKCLESSENAGQSKTMPGRITYFLGGMLPIKIKVPPSPQYTPTQPGSIGEIRENLKNLRPKMAEIAAILEKTTAKSGKTQHPALGYLNAKEWFQLIDMHFRHHLRQKARLDAFLKG